MIVGVLLSLILLVAVVVVIVVLMRQGLTGGRYSTEKSEQKIKAIGESLLLLVDQ